MLPYLLGTLALANLLTVSVSFGGLDLFSVLLPVIAARSCGCFYLGFGLLVSMSVATIHYGRGGVFAGTDAMMCRFGPQQLWISLIVNVAGIIIGVSGIPFFFSASLVSTSLACQLLLFDLDAPLSRETLMRQLGLLSTPLMSVLLTFVVNRLLHLYLDPKMENIADSMLALRPVVPTLFILGTLFFLATCIPVVFANVPLLLVSLIALFVGALLITKYVLGPRIKHMVFVKYPQCMSTYMEEGSGSDESAKSGLESARIVEVLSISQAGFAMVTFPGYASMAVSFVHHFCTSIQIDTSWGVPVGMTVTGAAVVISVHRLYKMINEKVTVDPIQGLSCQIATLLVCLVCTLLGVQVNFAILSLAAVFSSDYIKRRKSSNALLVIAVHSLIPLVISALLKSFIYFSG